MSMAWLQSDFASNTDLFTSCLNTYCTSCSAICSILLIGFAYSGISFADLQAHALNYLWLGGWIITLSIAASFQHPSLGLTGLFSGALVGNKMARSLFAMMSVSIFNFGFAKLIYLAFTIWQYDTASSLFVFCILVAVLLIIWHTANWLNQVDLRRIRAENELKVLNRELGKRVEERTAELSDLLEKYKESELKFRTVAEKSMLGVYIIQNKQFLYLNPQFAEIFGYGRQELMDLPTDIIDTIYAEESRTMVREKIRARDSGETEGAHYEAAGLKKDGARIHVEFYGNRVTINGEPAAVGTALDITERKKAEELLIESENRFRRAFEDSAIGMGLTSIEEGSMGRWLKVNRSLCEMLGYTEDELLSRTFMQITHPEDLARDLAAQERILQGESDTYRLDKRYIHKNGRLCLDKPERVRRQGQG